MEKGEERARANDTPPVLTGSLDSLRRLLEIEERRLEIAVAIEKKRDIVFPETTVIIHDIMKIQTAIEKAEKPMNNSPHTSRDPFGFSWDIDLES